MRKYLGNYSEIARRGAADTTDADFVVVQCVHCDRQYLYDEEVLRLYPDPEDLRKYALNIVGEDVSCVGCGRLDWDWIELDADSEEVRNGPWGWAR